MNETAIAPATEAGALTPQQTADRLLHLIGVAIEKGQDPEKLLGLFERIDRQRAEQEYAQAMNELQATLPRVFCDATNSHTGSKYPRIETLLEVIREPCGRLGFGFSWSEDPAAAKAGYTRLVCDVMHRGGHVKRHYGEYPLDGAGARGGSNMNALQGTVSAHTYAQRDMLRLILNITIAGKDKDGAQGERLLNGDEVKQVNDLLAEVQKVRPSYEYKKFLEWVRKLQGAPPVIENLADVPLALLPRILSMLGDARKPPQQKETK